MMCLHKEWACWNITAWGDSPLAVFICECGGFRIELNEVNLDN